MIIDLTLALLCVILVYGFVVWLLMKWNNEQL
jgi:flagellar biogenesis protein FliO